MGKYINFEVSLIIPCCNDHIDLSIQLKRIKDWTRKPDEIIIIDSSKLVCDNIKILQDLLLFYNVKLKYLHFKEMFPGKARNIGVANCSYDNICFIDVKTLPEFNWFEILCEEYISISGKTCIFGSTKYITSNLFSSVIKYSTFGNNTHLTLPGTLVNKNIFYKVGQFIEFTRAGEDTDWIKRFELHGFKIFNSQSILMYYNLDSLNIYSLIKKWFRNYSYSANMPYLNAHKNIYYYFVTFILIISGFNWNWVVAKWDVDSPYYIPHITKIILLLIISCYILFRGFLLPLRKGVNIFMLLKGMCFFVLIISFILDVVKLSAFIYARIKNA